MLNTSYSTLFWFIKKFIIFAPLFVCSRGINQKMLNLERKKQQLAWNGSHVNKEGCMHRDIPFIRFEFDHGKHEKHVRHASQPFTLVRATSFFQSDGVSGTMVHHRSNASSFHLFISYNYVSHFRLEYFAFRIGTQWMMQCFLIFFSLFT